MFIAQGDHQLWFKKRIKHIICFCVLCVAETTSNRHNQQKPTPTTPPPRGQQSNMPEERTWCLTFFGRSCWRLTPRHQLILSRTNSTQIVVAVADTNFGMLQANPISLPSLPPPLRYVLLYVCACVCSSPLNRSFYPSISSATSSVPVLQS